MLNTDITSDGLELEAALLQLEEEERVWLAKAHGIVFQAGTCYVKDTTTGYDVYRGGATCATLAGQFGGGPKYLAMAVEHCKKLASQSRPS